MCGIAGYVGRRGAVPLVLQGLRNVEYRGYDSAGIAITDSNGKIQIRRSVGKLHRLSKGLVTNPLPDGHLAIGHTRWATHGKPTQRNAHPHAGENVAVVHNGIIENASTLRKELETDGFRFQSDTDTEVIPWLVERELRNGKSPFEATRAAIARLCGSFAIGFLFKGESNLLIAVRQRNPLVLGFGSDGTLLGSAETALAGLANEVIHLEDGDVAIVTGEGAILYDPSGKKISRQVRALIADECMVSKGPHAHYMRKEMHEQPEMIGDTIRASCDGISHRVAIKDLAFDLKKVRRISFVGCGTAYHAALLGQLWFESLARIPGHTEVASEFRYRDICFERGEVGVCVSQSGETADTLAALALMKEHKRPTLAVVNVKGSTLSRDAGSVIYTKAGPEIGVASTKAFTTQCAILFSLALQAGRERNKLPLEQEQMLMQVLDELPGRIRDVLALEPVIQEIAGEMMTALNVLFLGRGLSYPVSLEGALKFTEITYKNGRGFPAGELKHGPLALVQRGVPIVVIAPPDRWFDKTASNVHEVASRGGKVLLLSGKEGCDNLKKISWRTVVMPNTHPLLSPMVYTVFLQLLAYHVALLLGHDIDKPRNLAKSVTVE